MGSLADRAVIKMALAARPELRSNLRELVRRIIPGVFSKSDLAAIEREFIGTIQISEALDMPSMIPAADQPLELTVGQFGIVQSIIARLRDPKLRTRLTAEVGAAVSADRVRIK